MSKKHSLVVGINEYDNFLDLSKCINDANDVNEFLTENSFEGEIVINPTQTELIHAISRFKSKIKEGDISLVYFSGHGLQDDRHNYMVCKDSNVQINEDIKYNCIWVEDLFLNETKENLHIVILDACRDNPFQDGRKGIKFGLLKMLAPHGTFISFSTSPNSKSIERKDDRNGIFTKHLLNNLRIPNLPIELAFKQTRNNVIADTGRRQIPWEESSLTGDNFSFVVKDTIDPIIEDIKQQFIDKIETVKLPIVLQALLKPEILDTKDYQFFCTLFDICKDLEWIYAMPRTLDADYMSDVQIEHLTPNLSQKIRETDNTKLLDFDKKIWNKIKIQREKNYGYYWLIDIEEFHPAIYSNEILIDGNRGIISCFLDITEDNQYRLKPLIIYIDDELKYLDYKEIIGNDVESFMEDYFKIREPFVDRSGPFDDLEITLSKE